VGGLHAPVHTKAWISATNAELVSAAQGGDHAAWTEIVRRYNGLVWSVTVNHSLGQIDGADITQTVWLKLAQYLGRLREPDRIGSWLISTTRNECLLVSRQRSRTIPVDVADRLVHVVEPVDNLSRLEDVERDFALWEAFLLLPGTCQALLKLLNTDPPTAYVEVANRCGIAIGSIGSRRQRCLSSLRVALKNHPAIVA
jgi:RNA polymerase sigma factor (sigma-70 family)